MLRSPNAEHHGPGSLRRFPSRTRAWDAALQRPDAPRPSKGRGVNRLTPRFIGFLGTDDMRWPEALSKGSHDFFHLPSFLKACSTFEDGEPVVFLLDAVDHGMLVPLLKRSLAPFGEEFKDFCDVTSPYGYGGPIFWGAEDAAVMAELYGRFEAFLREQRIVSMFLRLNPFLGTPDQLFESWGDLRTHGQNIYIDLRDDVGSWTGIHPNCRTFINRMTRSGCEVRIDDWETLDLVIEAYYETMSRCGATAYYYFPRTFFESLRKQSPDHFHLATSLDPEGQVTGGLFFSEVDGLIHDFLAGTFTRYLPLSPNKLLINAVREWGIRHGHHTLNLGGGLGARTDNIFRFKSLFSKNQTEFSTFRKILLPDHYEALRFGQSSEDTDFFPAYRQPQPMLD